MKEEALTRSSGLSPSTDGEFGQILQCKTSQCKSKHQVSAQLMSNSHFRGILSLACRSDSSRLQEENGALHRGNKRSTVRLRSKRSQIKKASEVYGRVKEEFPVDT